MTDLERVKWENDPEAFIILRLQESSDPYAAHKAFQAHLKEDAERDRNAAEKEAWVRGIESGAVLHEIEAERNILKAELAELREENARLRRGWDELCKMHEAAEAQRDTLLAALREIANPFEKNPHDLARVAISKVEGEKP